MGGIVVDLGAMPWGGKDVSVEPLVRRFEPSVLFAFDPHPDFVEGVHRYLNTTVIAARRAAWIEDCELGYTPDGIRSAVEADGAETIQGFDFVNWLRALPRVPLVVKMDIEGSEYPLCFALHRAGVDCLIDLLLVEWHTGEYAHGHGDLIPRLRCPVEEWD